MRIPGIILAVLAVALGTSSYVARAGHGAAPVDRLDLAPCHLEGLAEEVSCGVLDVVEDRDAGSGRTISIHVSVLGPLRREAAPDPLFIMAGGPGQGARSYAAAVARSFRRVRATRAIVLVDLRGTGDSAPLRCGDALDEVQALSRGRDALLGSGAGCVAGLDADPRHYTHRDALADLDAVRQRLGYDTINLWGGSWGTRAALLYAISYPQAVRRVVLDGAVGLGMRFPVTAAEDAQRAFDLLAARCADDEACAREFPDSRRELEGMLARLERTPARVRIAHPRTGARVTVTITRETAAEILRVALYTTVDAARVPAIVRRAALGDFAPLVAQYHHSARLSSDDMARGTTMAVLCSEDLPRVVGEDLEAAAGGSFLRTSYADGWVERCNGWPVGPAIGVDPAAISNAPALILSGALDPVTPPRAGDTMARHFPDNRHVIVPGAAHNTSFTGCVPDLIASFLDGVDIDAACVDDVPAPPVETGLAGGRP